MLAAIEVIKAADQAGAKTFTERPPASFLSPKWHKLIFASGPAERRLYETAVLAALRDRLRGPTSGWLAAEITAHSKTISCQLTGKQSPAASAARQIQPAMWQRVPGCCVSN